MSYKPLEPALIDLAQASGWQHRDDLPFGKVLFDDPANDRIVKLGSDPVAQGLIRAEAAGLERLGPLLKPILRVAEGRLLHDDDDGVALAMSRLDGETASKWSTASYSITAALAPSQSTAHLSELVAQEPCDEASRDLLLKRFGDPLVPVSPSHGDNIYWNVLLGGDRPGLIDFEYAGPRRVAGYDDLHHRLAPWLTRICRSPWLPDRCLIPIGRAFARTLVRDHHLELPPRLLLALFFLHWAGLRRSLNLAPESFPYERIERLATIA